MVEGVLNKQTTLTHITTSILIVCMLRRKKQTTFRVKAQLGAALTYVGQPKTTYGDVMEKQRHNSPTWRDRGPLGCISRAVAFVDVGPRPPGGLGSTAA